MRGYDAATFGERMAEYDSLDWALEDDELAASAFLAGIAPGRRALELGIGTGRVALPLSNLGFHILGVEASVAMVRQLKAKAGSGAIDVVAGDFAVAPESGEFDLAYCVNSTFFLLRTQEEQLQCMSNVAARLRPGGVLVLQTLFPDAPYVPPRSEVSVLRLDLERVVLAATTHDSGTQRVDSQRVVITERNIKLYPLSYRYAWPSELDLMARSAGLALLGRWNGWANEPFAASGNYVSAYRKP
jgi:SAM-dependent methyltransferase